jgi:FHA domain-containing protein
MLKLQATSFSNQRLLQPVDAEFDELGGNIGRSEGNTLILSDDKRYISRTQASITFRGGSYYLRDHGSATPTIVNGSPVGNGNEVPLREGDELRIGEYVLVAHLDGASPAAADPFADLLPGTPRAQPAPPLPAAAPAPRISDPFDDPFAAPASSPAHASKPGVIPADFDPFSDLLPQGNTPAPSPASSAPDLMPSSGETVDDLFGLSQPNTWDPLSDMSGAGGHDILPADAGSDPFADLMPSPANRPQKATQRDDAPMLSSALPRAMGKQAPAGFASEFPAAQPQRQQAVPQPARAQPASAPQALATPAPDIVLSWDTAPHEDPGQEIKTVILPSPKKAAAAAERLPRPEPAQARPAAPEVRMPAPQPRAAPAAAAPPRAAATPQEADELLRAFLDGAGMEDLNIPGGLTPEFMNLIGRLMHESLRGTLDLLLARALTKREVRAQATVIVARENNPLKFSPSVDAAFNNLLAPQGKGFMAPADAMRDAYNDLRSHQFGFMAGMRAALEGVLARFDPAQLEGRLTRKSVLGSLVPASRRAKLWELYEHLYREISKEAQDDFQTLFGKEFLRAYEAQIDKLEQEDAATKR